MGRPFAAVIKLTPEFKPEFDFGNDQNADGRRGGGGGFHGQGAARQMSEVRRARVRNAGMNYVCEKATGPAKTCTFRTGKIILQQPIERAQMQKLLTTGKTDLLEKFISKKDRPFKAFLVVKDGKVGLSSSRARPRPDKGAAKDAPPRAPAAKIDFTGQEPLGKCPKCGGRVFEGEPAYRLREIAGGQAALQVQDRQSDFAAAD